LTYGCIISHFLKKRAREKGGKRDRVGVTKRNRERKIERFNLAFDDYPNNNIIVCCARCWEWGGGRKCAWKNFEKVVVRKRKWAQSVWRIFLLLFLSHFSLQLEIATNTYTYMLQPEDIKKNEFLFPRHL